MKQAMHWPPLNRQPYRAKAAITIALFVVMGLLLGLSVALLPLQLTMVLSGFFLSLVAVAVVAVAPPMRTFPSKTLAWGLVIALVFYFVWPRNVFLPIKGLPVKHPQRLFYLLFLAYAGYVLLKCSPARAQVMRGFRALPWLSGAWIALTFWQLLSLIFAQYTFASIGPWFVDLLVVTLVYPLVLLSCQSPEDFKRLLAGLLVAALANCLFAIPEAIQKKNLFERFISLDILDPLIAEQVIAAKIRSGAYRAQAAFDHPLLLAEYLVVCLPIALMLVLEERRRVIGLLATGLLMVGLILSHSRIAAVAGLVVIASCAGLLIIRGAHAGRRNAWPLTVSLLASPVLVLGAILATDTISKLAAGRTALEAGSSSVRLQMLAAGWRLVQQQPVFGYGPSTAGAVLNFQNTVGVVTLDNYLLVIALDSGLPALLFFCFLVLSVSWTSLKHSLGSGVGTLWRTSAAIFSASLAFLIVKAVLGTPLNNLVLLVWAGGLSVLAQARMNFTTGKVQYVA